MGAVPDSAYSETSNISSTRRILTAPPPKLLPLPSSNNNPSETSTAWTSQSVVQWLENILQTVEDAEHHQQQQLSCSPFSHFATPSFVVAGVNLAAPSSPLAFPSSCPWSRPTTTTSNNIEFHYNTMTTTNCPPLVPQYWEHFVELCQQDPQGFQAQQQIASIALQVESKYQDYFRHPNHANTTTNGVLPANNNNNNPYRIIQQRFQNTLESLLLLQPDDPQQRMLLDTLYSDTVDSLQNLLNPRKVPIATRHIPKQDFSKYMNQWLIDNWSNPYPDDTILQQISTICSVPTQVISNWLINARTRKWRPAIVRALQLPHHRPSCMLLEDSLHIYLNKPIRNLEEDTLEYGSAGAEDFSGL